MRKKLLLIIIFCSAVTFLKTAGQNTEYSKITLEDLYQNNVFRQKGINAVRWMKDNKRYSALEDNSAIGGKDIVAYNAASGKREVLIAAERLIPAGQKVPLVIRLQGESETTSPKVMTIILSHS